MVVGPFKFTKLQKVGDIATTKPNKDVVPRSQKIAACCPRESEKLREAERAEFRKSRKMRKFAD